MDPPELKLTEFPDPPEYNNSAGRLLALLTMLQRQSRVWDMAVQLYEPRLDRVSEHDKIRRFVALQQVLGEAFDELLVDIEKIPDEAQRIIVSKGIAGIIPKVFYPSPSSPPERLTPSDISVLEMAGNLIRQEPRLSSSEEHEIRESIDDLSRQIKDSDLKPKVKRSLLDTLRIAQSALSHYTIHGGKGFKKAFKAMLAELMAIYMEEGDDVTKHALWPKVIQFAKRIDVVAAKLNEYQPLLEKAGTLFIGGS